MDDFDVIDVHIHLARTMEEHVKYHPLPGRRMRDRYGTPERAIEFMDISGISKMVFLTLPPRHMREPLAEKAKLGNLPKEQRRKEQERINKQMGPIVREMNEWGCKIGKRFPRLIPFITLAEELGGPEDIVKEVVVRAEQGARGIKLHPGEFCSFPDDEIFWPTYAKIQELKLPIIADSAPFSYTQALSIKSRVTTLHASAWSNLPQTEVQYGEPDRFARLLEAFPRLTLVLAHVGLAWWDERIDLARKFPNVCFDTSQGFSVPDQVSFNPHRGLAEEDAVRVMRKIGVKRIMFGTDFPTFSTQAQLEQILRLPFTDEEKRMILAENARRILHI